MMSHANVDDRVTQSRLSALIDTFSDKQGEMERDVSRRLTLEEINEYARDREAVQADHTRDVFNDTQRFQRNTESMGQMNEAYSANRYISDMLQDENNRVAVLNAEARREVYKLQQRVMSSDHRAHYHEFLTRVFVFTLIATMLVTVLLAAWMQGRVMFANFVIMAAIVLALYALLLALLFNRNTKRRQVHWNQYYWAAPSDEKETC